MIEYAVMRQIGEADPEVYEEGFKDKQKAWNALGKAENSLYEIQCEGINVRNAAEAEAAVKQLDEIGRSRFYIARREVTEWEEV